MRPAPSTTPHISANEILETPRSELENLNSDRPLGGVFNNSKSGS